MCGVDNDMKGIAISAIPFRSECGMAAPPVLFSLDHGSVKTPSGRPVVGASIESKAAASSHRASRSGMPMPRWKYGALDASMSFVVCPRTFHFLSCMPLELKSESTSKS
jgi:hypothetical protein